MNVKKEKRLPLKKRKVVVNEDDNKNNKLSGKVAISYTAAPMISIAEILSHQNVFSKYSDRCYSTAPPMNVAEIEVLQQQECFHKPKTFENQCTAHNQLQTSDFNKKNISHVSER